MPVIDIGLGYTDVPAPAIAIRRWKPRLKPFDALLRERGLILHRGIMPGATLLAAPFSAKNDSGGRDSGVPSTNRCDPSFCGGKTHSRSTT
jgi:hypothetical protein